MLCCFVRRCIFTARLIISPTKAPIDPPIIAPSNRRENVIGQSSPKTKNTEAPIAAPYDALLKIIFFVDFIRAKTIRISLSAALNYLLIIHSLVTVQ